MLRINLFGKFGIRCGQDAFKGATSLKSRELLAYLLLNRDRPHAREKVASRLWGDRCTTAQSKKYLRNALWQLQSALSDQADVGNRPLLFADPDWIQLNSIPSLHLDVHVFETAYAAVEGIPGYTLEEEMADTLDQALELYLGDLLEGWYQEWCIYDRERILQLYLMMLDKMMIYSEAHRQFEKGLAYGHHILRRDRARECTHRRMMRLYYLAGDRSTALRQYDQCALVLAEELGVEPSRRTTALYDQLRTDQWASVAPRYEQTSGHTGMEEVLQSLHHLHRSLAEVRQHVQQTAEQIGAVMRKP
jgi:DNA-binding SARP family transcriptional activator